MTNVEVWVVIQQEGQSFDQWACTDRAGGYMERPVCGCSRIPFDIAEVRGVSQEVKEKSFWEKLLDLIRLFKF